MIDFLGICNGLASRFAPGTISTPSGAVAMRAAIGQMPKSAPTVPMVYVEVTQGTVTANPAQWQHVMEMDVVFLLSKRPGDPVRVEKQRQTWLPTLLAATEGKLKLGIGVQSGYEVQKALPTQWRWDEVVVGGEDYDAIRISFQVWVLETVSLVP